MTNTRVSGATLGTIAILLTLSALSVWLLFVQSAPLQWMPPPRERWAWSAAAVLGYVAALVLGSWWRQRHLRPAMAVLEGGASPVLVAYASQTGFAERIAIQTAGALQAAQLPVHLRAIETLDVATLAGAGRALFVVSTTGEGDAPDAAFGFVRQVMGAQVSLSSLQFGVLALGDSSYQNFCAFGRTLEGWLRHQGAVPLFDRVEVDNGDAGALRHWQHYLGLLAGSTEMADWSAPQYARWRLVERRLLNPGSPAHPAFHVALEPIDGSADWQAGDVAEIGPRNDAMEVASLLDQLELGSAAVVSVDGAQSTLSQLLCASLLPHDRDALEAWRGLAPQALAERAQPLPHREYSIASIPAEGRIELLVRQTRHADGRLGLGSGWLTAHAPVGGEIALRIRENRRFHAPAVDCPLILIGNGTGLAGLRAHLKARAVAGQTRNWLLFGERTAAHDYFHREEIEAWQAAGLLQRLDLAFSRDQPERIHVQQRLREAAPLLREWVADGAAIYVCGSVDGMAPAVDQVLREALGVETLETLIEQGRYRRDVY